VMSGNNYLAAPFAENVLRGRAMGECHPGEKGRVSACRTPRMARRCPKAKVLLATAEPPVN